MPQPVQLSNNFQKAMREVLEEEDLPYYFNVNLFNRNFHPDISGYTVIGMVPPVLSGYGQAYQNQIEEIADNSFFLGLEPSTPDVTIKNADVSSGSGAIPYATGKSSGNNLSINFIENQDLDIFYLHHLWTEYIKEVLYGEVSPSAEYYSQPIPVLDYVGSIFVAKFKPDMKSITYIGKAVGVFPSSLPTNDMIGQRSENQLTMTNISYNITKFEGVVVKDGEAITPQNEYVLKEFKQLVHNRISLTGSLNP